MAANRPSRQKGKAAVPKPAQGSGLNPSGHPAADQLNIAAEQPSMSAFSFNPHQLSQDGQEGWQIPDNSQQSYQDIPLMRKCTYASGAPHTSNSNSNYFPQHTSNSNNDHFPPHASNSNSKYFPQHTSNSNDDHFPPHTSNDNGHFQSQPFPDDRFTEPAFGDDNDNDHTSFYENQNYNRGHFNAHRTPLPPWVDEAPNHGAGIVDRGNGLVPPATNIALIRQGEIPHDEVTRGPAHTTRKRNTRAALPRTPYFVPQAPCSVTELTNPTTPQPLITQDPAVTSKTVRSSKEDIEHAVKGAKVLIAQVMFTKHAMTQKAKTRLAQVEDAIKDSTRCLEDDVTVENFITRVHTRQVSNTLSAIRGKVVQFSRDGVFLSYSLFPPRGSITTAKDYHITTVNKLIRGADPLLFMHAYFVNEHGDLIVTAKFQNVFIMASVVRFVWHAGREAFLGKSPLKAIKYVVALVGSTAHCALQEQRSLVITLNAFSGL
ncbi:hypothetical protein DEU56DRAFT_909166 [Suillus clintonianus]|uniref:uncharacterized protein n=1 Tax=Suillus clintonianus TaxID=1904413 RepID=UPI001B87F377|nr:uncharacterized protein DEU56DRAFT_909166 [Suillus clintonianus]KAG2148852.1 hypothetical protein DEU56DRAFT_909166 [Suillus clintonianus]